MKRRAFLKRAAIGGGALTLASPLSAQMMKIGTALSTPRLSQDFNPDWQFLRETIQGAESLDFTDNAWETVNLPHTAKVEALVTGPPDSDTFQWQGECWYRKHFSVGPEATGQLAFLQFGAAMNVADVWINGHHVGRHLGGFLPFTLDVSDHLRPGEANLVAVRLDNTDNPQTGPKPLEQLDFNMYGGLYRDVQLVLKDPLHITDPLFVDRPASGGVFVRFPEVSPARATVEVQVHVENRHHASRQCHVRLRLEDAHGRVVAKGFTDSITLESGEEMEFMRALQVLRPALWSPRTPNLYTLHTELLSEGRQLDEAVTRIGIRRIEITAEGFSINGERMFLRGTNRHQEYPYIGYAIGSAAQHRDARKIKEAGFDYVRLSHYPHDPAFMDACDELGLVVMNCIPGWQYFNHEDPLFTEIQYRNCRQMIRRDRNHPCVILWEVSLNETAMPDAFIRETHGLAHEEFPGDQMFTCGWTEGYDVFIQARQHGGCQGITDRPCVVSEYGDWEYYAQNAGLAQDAWADLAPDEANSRQLRSDGERALLQQVTNFQEGHNDNRKTTAFGDGLWVMFDYNRGYAPDIESSGCMDLFRLPKFSTYFFQSQRNPKDHYANAASGPMVFIASHWTPASARSIRVFSNCEEVALYLNDVLIERRSPDRDRLSSHLAHPPFTFQLEAFQEGTLTALGWIDGQEAARHVVRTPGPIARIDLSLDLSGQDFAVRGKDTVFAHAALVDARGTLVPGAWENVSFGAIGPVQLIGANPFSSEAGIASILVQTATRRPRAALYALSIVQEGDKAHILAASSSAGGSVLPYEIRWSAGEGTSGQTGSPYDGPIPYSEDLRAVLSVAGKVIVSAEGASPKFRIPGSVSPK